MLTVTIQQETNTNPFELKGVPFDKSEKVSTMKRTNNAHASTADKFKTSFYNPFEVKHRRRTSRAQFKVLEKTFLENPKPNAAVRRWLAETLAMTPRGVQVWFQNRRAKDKVNQQKRAPLQQQSPSVNYRVELEEIDVLDTVTHEESRDNWATRTAGAEQQFVLPITTTTTTTMKREDSHEGNQYQFSSNYSSPLTTTTTIPRENNEAIMLLPSSPVYSVPCACHECYTATTNANVIHAATATPMSRTLSYPPFFSSDTSATTTVADEEELLLTPATPTSMDYYYYKHQQQQQQQTHVETPSITQSNLIRRFQPFLLDQRRYSYPSQQQAYCYPYNSNGCSTHNNNSVFLSTPTSLASPSPSNNNNNLDLFRRFSEPIFIDQQQHQFQPTAFNFDAYFNLIPTHSLSSTKTAATL